MLLVDHPAYPRFYCLARGTLFIAYRVDSADAAPVYLPFAATSTVFKSERELQQDRGLVLADPGETDASN